ncbi:MAG: hypothetical protein KDA57_15925 [Planctomycetales bacterium]|nr:hypothetical protein [Planctomycetales bacterium]
MPRLVRLVSVTIVLLGSIISMIYAADPLDEFPVTEAPPGVEPSSFMRAKLASSQAVLEGLVTEDFELVAKGAHAMAKMSEAAEWPRAPDKVYDHFSAEFRRLARKLVRLAAEENLEGATFTHMHMTTTCISCHEYVRGAFRVAEGPQGSPGVQLIPSEWPR